MGKVNEGFALWESGLMPEYSEKFMDDCYIDAYSSLCGGKSFCLELVLVPRDIFFLTDDYVSVKKVVVDFKVVVRTFSSSALLKQFVDYYGAEKIIEVYYSNF